MAPDLQFYYKCIDAKIPERQFSVFVTEEWHLVDKLVHKHEEKDSRSDDTTGYATIGSGDSGGPYWTYDRVSKNHERSVVVAVHSSNIGSVDIKSDKQFQCRIIATKITDDILDWIKIKSGIK